MSEGTVRVKKAATEFNISVQHLVEHLASKGFSVESNPNAKISDEMYQALLRDFGQDKKIKEQAAQIHIGKAGKEDLVLDQKSVSQSPKSRAEQKEVLIKGMGTNTGTTPAKAKKAEAELPKAPKTETVVPEPEKTPDHTPTPEPVVEAKAEPVTGLKVVGKIDLSTEATKGPKKSKKKSDSSEAEATTPAQEPTPENQLQGEGAEPAAVSKGAKPTAAPKENPTAETQPAPSSEENKPEGEKKDTPEELVRAVADRLQGTTVLGKIDVSQFQKRKPVASSATDQVGKRKRKRVDGSTPEPGAAADPNQRPSVSGVGSVSARPPRGRTGEVPGRRGAAATGPKAELTEKEIQDQIKATLARLQSGKGTNTRSKFKKQMRRLEGEESNSQDNNKENRGGKTKLQLTEFITTGELAGLMDVAVGEVIMKCFALGIVVTINQRLDAETIVVVADEFGYDVSFISAAADEPMLEEADNPDNMQERAPIVTIMGHVDHGKTSLLDYIRKANVIAGEAGGITQHIGAYEVTLPNNKHITFLDTPGHEAFTAMRARGAKVTDIVVIVIAADDKVMPQTKEAISHAQAAGVPMIFAINKIDRPEANPEKIREQLSAMNILVESWGGKYQDQEISAKKGLNVELLLEKILLEAEVLELKADPDKRAVGTIIEASLDKGRGVVATVLIESGTLQTGDPILAGAHYGRVKVLQNERGQKIAKVGPAQPVQILGFATAPTAGERFYVAESESAAREISNKRQQLMREQGMRTRKHITLDEIGRRLAIGNFKELNLIVKGDVDGSVEALSDSLLQLSTKQIQVNVVHKGVGQITESDIMLASASDAIIVGFQVRPLASVRRLAEQEEIDIRTYSIIYDAIDEIKSAMEGMLAPTFEEKVVANVEIREVFKITKVGSVAGCMVLDGKINRNTKVRVLRDGVVIYTGELASLKRFKEDVKEVATGYECGLNIQNFNDIKVGDLIEGYERIEVKAKL
ncbi:MAG: translation initiation factor IF-2 [Sphingobacteriia bacterium]|nr:translation initiation factor IF-2 [Sphingobacteriia bacterium]